MRLDKVAGGSFSFFKVLTSDLLWNTLKIRSEPTFYNPKNFEYKKNYRIN